jgi:hypothetical protein
MVGLGRTRISLLLQFSAGTASAYSQGDPSAEYFIGVKSIKINGKVVPLNKTLLSFFF